MGGCSALSFPQCTWQGEQVLTDLIERLGRPHQDVRRIRVGVEHWARRAEECLTIWSKGVQVRDPGRPHRSRACEARRTYGGDISGTCADRQLALMISQ